MRIDTIIRIGSDKICVEKCNIKNECLEQCISTPPTLATIVEFLTKKVGDSIERTFRGAMKCLDSIAEIDEKLARQRVFFACAIPVGRRQWQAIRNRIDIDLQKLKQEVKQVKKMLRKISGELRSKLIDKHGCYVVESIKPYSSVFSSLVLCLDATKCRWRLPFRVLTFQIRKRVDEPMLEVIVAIGKRSIMVVVDDYGNLTIITATMACSDEDRRIQVLSTIIEKLSTLLPPSDFEQALREIATKLGIEEIRTLGEIIFG